MDIKMDDRLSNKEKHYRFIEEAINKMFDISGYSEIKFKDIKDSGLRIRDLPYYFYFFYTKSQRLEFRKWYMKKVLSVFNIRDEDAELEFDKFDYLYGLSNKKESEKNLKEIFS